MKRFRSTLALLAFLLALGVWAWRERDAGTEDNPIRFEAEAVRSIRLARAGASLLLSRRGADFDSWTVRAQSAQTRGSIPPEAPADAASVREVLEAWARARPQSLLPDQPARLKEFGLAAGAPTLSIDALSITLGAPAPINPLLFYARIQSGGGQSGGGQSGGGQSGGGQSGGGQSGARIALLPLSLKLSLDKSLFEWRDKRLLSFDSGRTQEVRASLNGDQVLLQRRGAGWRWSRSKIGAAAPSFAADPEAASGALNALLGLTAVQFAPLQARTFGAGATEIRLRQSDGHVLAARIGTVASKNRVAASSSRLPDAALIEPQASRELAALWKRPAAAWRLKALFDFRVDDAAEVVIRAQRPGSREQKWRRNAQDKSQWQRVLPTAALDPMSPAARYGASAVTDLLLQMSQLRARDFVPLSAPAGQAVLEMRVATPGGEERLEIVRLAGSSERLAARVSSSLRDDDDSTLFVLEDDALAPFQTSLGVLGS